MSNKKDLLLVTFKKNNTKALFKSVQQFVTAFCTYSPHTIQNYISRKNEPFEDEFVKIEKVGHYKG